MCHPVVDPGTKKTKDSTRFSLIYHAIFMHRLKIIAESIDSELKTVILNISQN